MKNLRQRNVKSIDATQNSSAPPIEDLNLTTKRELNAFYLLKFAFGPAISIVYIFFPLLVATHGRYAVANNQEGIEWRRTIVNGELCEGPVEGPLGQFERFDRPEGFPEDCVWFPRNPTLYGSGIHYAALASYVLALMLFLAGMAIWFLGPFADRGDRRKFTLLVGFLTWPTLSFLMVLACQDLGLWWMSGVAIFSGAMALFSLKAVLDGYLMLLIGSHPDIVGVELTSSPKSPYSVRSMPAFGNPPEFRASRRVYSLQEPQEPMEDLVSVLLTIVTPRGNFRGPSKPRPEFVPKLDLSSIKEADAPKAAHAPPDTARMAEMEFGGGGQSFDENESFDCMRYKHVVENVVTNAASAEVLGQGLGILAQALTVFGLGGWLSHSLDFVPYQGVIILSAVWAWGFGTYGYSGLKARSIRSRVKGMNWLDDLLGAVKLTASTLRSIRNSMSDVWKLRVSGAILMVAVRTLQAMGGVFVLTEFGFGSSKVMMLLLAYTFAGPFANLVSYLLLWLSSGPNGKLTVLKVHVLAMALFPLWPTVGVKTQQEVFMAAMLASLVISPIPTILASLQSDMVPSSWLNKMMATECSMETLGWWVGPLLVGMCLDATGSIRAGLLTVSALVSLAVPFVLSIDVNRAIRDMEHLSLS
ncbi:hypothetical protein BSKO_07266 [Bryopsis sp. KO-2023]|nr:hypothetical protein BSKO_07266 [Bryopsis sp. KO-2023]